MSEKIFRENVAKFKALIEKDISQFGRGYGVALAQTDKFDLILYQSIKEKYGDVVAVDVMDCIGDWLKRRKDK